MAVVGEGGEEEEAARTQVEEGAEGEDKATFPLDGIHPLLVLTCVLYKTLLSFVFKRI